MKILIFGGKGWIGTQFVSYLSEANSNFILSTTSNFILAISRADDSESVRNEILKYQPTHIISFIGRTHGENINTIDYLEQPGKLHENIKDNLYAPMVLSMLCKQYGIHYTYIGTGCIFTSEDPTSEFFDEDNEPNFFGSSYSIVKGYTDRLMHLQDNVLNLRIRMPITDNVHPRNFITKIVNYEKICSIPNSMTVINDMLPVIYDMMEKEITGTFNMVNSGLISHDEILTMYREIIDPSFTWKNFTIEEQNKILKSQRSNNQLNTSKLYTLYPNIPDIKTSVKICLTKMKK